MASSFFHSMIADGKKLFLKKLFNFNLGNTINISLNIICKKTFIFENFLVAGSFLLSNYRLTADSSNYILK